MDDLSYDYSIANAIIASKDIHSLMSQIYTCGNIQKNTLASGCNLNETYSNNPDFHKLKLKERAFNKKLEYIKTKEKVYKKVTQPIVSSGHDISIQCVPTHITDSNINISIMKDNNKNTFNKNLIKITKTFKK